MYTLLIDESGDQGINKIASESGGGSPPIYAFGAALLHDYDLQKARNVVSDISDAGHKTHCADIKSHAEKAKVGRLLCEIPIITTFQFVSDKSSLNKYAEVLKSGRGGAKPHQRYNDKCLQFLLECVGQYFDEMKLEKGSLTIVIEDAQKIDLLETERYLTLCRDTPKYGTAHLLTDLPVDKFVSETKDGEPALFLADYIAHAAYKAFDTGPKTHGIPETRYFEEIVSKPYITEIPDGYHGLRTMPPNRTESLPEREKNIINRIFGNKILVN